MNLNDYTLIIGQQQVELVLLRSQLAEQKRELDTLRTVVAKQLAEQEATATTKVSS